jgi:hypothetical protein
MRGGRIDGRAWLAAHAGGCAAVCGNLGNVRRDRLEAAVLDALRDNLMNPELLREFCAEHLRELNRVRGDGSARRDRLRLELTQVERRLRRSVAAIADGVSARTLKDELLALEARQEQLEAEFAAAPEAQQPPGIPTWPRSTGAKWRAGRGAGGRGAAG